MRKLLNKPWFVALLSIAAIGFVWNSVRDPGRSHSHRRVPAPVAATGANDGEEPALESAPATLREALLALAIPVRLSDPFAPRAEAASASSAASALPSDPDRVEKVRVSAVWQQHGETLALVNDRICQAGDAIGRLTIESAAIDGVLFTHWKGRDFVRIGAEFTLVTPSGQPANPPLALNER